MSPVSPRRRRLLLFVSLLVACASCGPRPPSSTPPPAKTPPVPVETSTPAQTGSAFRFADVTASSGIRFVHRSGDDRHKYYPTAFGSGVALLDYDGDGRLDVYLCTTRNLPITARDESGGNRLYRNLGGMRFEDVSEKAGVLFRGFTHGATVGDVNNDGHPDLFLTNLGPNVLYLNNGDGTFRDASASSGLMGLPWSLGATFLDYDADGKLDLYVTTYAIWDIADDLFCGDKARDLRVFCSPFQLTSTHHALYRGRGDGMFEDTTERAGVARTDGRGLGVVAADVNGDGRTDLYVANDGCPNFLFLNRGDGTFEDISEASGAATDEAGNVQGSMGVAAQDVDGDGLPELFVTNFRGQYNTLYHNHDGRSFEDKSAVAGIVKDSRPLVGWGCSLEDFDSDGLPDMFVVNGEIDDNLPLFGQAISYELPPLFYRNLGDGRFGRITDSGPFFSGKHAGRGAAFGDLDNDGDLDAVVSRMNTTPIVLRNDTPQGHWIRFALRGTRSNRSALGATVVVHAGGRRFWRAVKGGESYLSSNDTRLHVGLGTIDRVDEVEVRWPDGKTSTVESPAIGRTHELVEPEGAR